MGHIIDSEFYRDNWGTDEMRAVFDDRRRFQRWLDIEALLADVQAELGVIPAEAATEIRRNASIDLLDPDEIRAGIARSAHSLMPLLNAVARRCTRGLGEYIHFGPTAQDIEDTGGVLEMRDAFRILLRDMIRLETSLLSLADEHAELPMAGRTHKQHGLPITLGLKIAGWAAEIRRDIERMKDMSKRVFVGMMHGGTGTMAGLGPRGRETASLVIERLGLIMPPTGWGSARDGMAEYQLVLGMVAGSVGRIANEIFQLSSTEVGELAEPVGDEYVGSSTMPHKRNAEASEFVVALARVVMSNVQLGMQAMISEHERDSRSWRLDWHSIPESSIMLARALASLLRIVDGLLIDEGRISANLDRDRGRMFSEAIMFRLGEKIGKQTAHKLIRDAAIGYQKKSESFREILLRDPAIARHITPDELDELMDYSKHLGDSKAQVVQVIEESKRLSTRDSAYLELDRPMKSETSQLTICYRDPVTGARGYLVIDQLRSGLAAGGLRIDRGIELSHVAALARVMTQKQRVYGLDVGGAKAGIDLAPDSPERRGVLRRFMEHMRPWILEHWSVGPDMNTTMAELEAVAQELSIPSLKIAVARRKGIDDAVFLRRYALFESKVGGESVNNLRGAAGVAAAARVLLERAVRASPASIAIQGAGNMGGGTALLMARSNVRVVAWADNEKCLVSANGLDVEALYRGRKAGRLPDTGAYHRVAPDAVLRHPADVLALCATSRAFTDAAIPTLGCRSIVGGANLALDISVERALHRAGVMYLPELVASAGGSLAVEALYAANPNSGADVLKHVDDRVTRLAQNLVQASHGSTRTPREIVEEREIA